MRTLVTGIAGFAGSHLADYLLAHGDEGVEATEVHGICLPDEATHNLQHLLSGSLASSGLRIHKADLRDGERVRDIVAATRPECVFHLAAQAAVDRAWANPAETLINNIIIQLNLLQAIVQEGLLPRILVVGSADEYGLVSDPTGILDEDAPLRPLNPYAVSKIAQDYLAYQYHLSHGLAIVRVRPFNHIGPRQGPGFVVADFARQIARIEAGLQPPLMGVGNLDAIRDFCDVRDIVRGYELALRRGRIGGVYNLGSGRGYAIREILDRLLQQSSVEIRVESDASRMRPSDVPILVCDNRRIREDTGWEPRYDLDRTLADVVHFWRERTADLSRP